MNDGIESGPGVREGFSSSVSASVSALGVLLSELLTSPSASVGASGSVMDFSAQCAWDDCEFFFLRASITIERVR